MTDGPAAARCAPLLVAGPPPGRGKLNHSPFSFFLDPRNSQAEAPPVSSQRWARAGRKRRTNSAPEPPERSLPG
eukprot:364033-Chlamydomonas_euryale.AAC.1